MTALSRWLLFCTLLGLFSLEAGAERIITDSAGRRVTVPDRVERVFVAGPPASVYVYVLAPEKLLGWPRQPYAEEKPFLAAPYRDLPELGRLTGRGNTANVEVVLKSRPDLILDVGAINPTYISLAERVQQQTGVSYLLVDGSLANIPSSLRLLGTALGVSERAEKLARYTEQTYRDLTAVLATIPPERRPRVYLARGPDGLETGVRGSINTEIIEWVGAVNVVDAPGQQGLATVSYEQVLNWNPEIIITLDERFFAKVFEDPRWQAVTAVKTKRVYLAPRWPFGWVDRPPALNRIVGIRWLGRLFYPEAFKDDLRQLSREFYSLFYHLDLSDAQLDTLLAGARSP